MSTIRIDRGFTQKIQKAGLVHSPMQGAPPPRKKPRGGPKGLLVALVVGAGLLGVIVLAFVLFKGGGDKAKKPQPAVAAQPAPPAVQTAAKPSEAGLPVDPDEAVYANHTGSTSSQPQQAAAGPVLREVPLGSPQGLLCEYYENVLGKTVTQLRAALKYPGNPTRKVQVGQFSLSENVGNQYGVRMRGYLVPATSGKYRFSVCADDTAELWLSTDDKPANMRKLIDTNGPLPKNQWETRNEQQSEWCELAGGRRYYVEAFLKESLGHDYLTVAWKTPGATQYALIEGRFLQPWIETEAADAASDTGGQRKPAKGVRSEAIAAAHAAVEEQRRNHGAAYRYAEAANALKSSKPSFKLPIAKEIVETAILRFELLGRLRAFVQAELAQAPVRGVWTAFGGQADVTAATEEGVTVAPGRIVEWAKVPPDQMLRLVNATVPKTVSDPNTKAVLFLAAAVFCKEVTGGDELALKYRERALGYNASLAALADRVLGDTP